MISGHSWSWHTASQVYLTGKVHCPSMLTLYIQGKYHTVAIYYNKPQQSIAPDMCTVNAPTGYDVYRLFPLYIGSINCGGIADTLI